MSSPAFYLPDGEGFLPTESTRGPWDPNAQHAGPPAALLGRAVELAHPRQDVQVARFTFDILAPVPMAPLEVSTRMVRPGRSVEVIETELSSGGETVMRGVALRIRRTRLELPDDPVSAPRGPEEGYTVPFFPTGQEVGYHTAMEWRFVEGSFLKPGPATAWARMRRRLVPDEEPSPLCRVLIAADSGNGISAALDYRRHVYINPDLTVSLHRYPMGDWVCLEAATIIEPNGRGLAESVIYDRFGRLGRSLQTLFIAER